MNKFHILILFSLVLLFGCITDSNEVTVPDSNEVTIPDSNDTVVSEPQELGLYGGNLFSEGLVSVCNIISDSEVEDVFGFSEGQLSHLRSHISIANITSSTCSYKSMEQKYYKLELNYRKYSTSDIYNASDMYDAFEKLLPEGDTGKIGDYYYVYYVDELSGYVLDVKIPEANTLIEFFASENFPNANKEKIIEIAELFLSRIDPTLEQDHEFIQSSGTGLTYKGYDITFDYPSNWIANNIYGGSDDKVSVEDPDGISLMIIGSGSADPLLNSEKFAEIIENYESQGAEILYQSEDNGKYTIISGADGYVSILQSGIANDQKSFAVLGIIQNVERYNCYKSEIIEILESTRSS